MKALSIQQPWASLIVAGIKDVENRTWSTRYRGPLAVHAGSKLNKATARDAFSRLERVQLVTLCNCIALTTSKDVLTVTLDDVPRGAVIGVVDVVDVIRTSKSKWALEDHFHWVLRNPRPVRAWWMSGRLGLFDVPDGLASATEAA